MAAKSKGLNPKQTRFVQEYLVDLNATQAAIRAGYSKKTANPQAARLLANASVKQAVKIGQEKRASKLEITQERVLQEIAAVAFSDVRQLYDEKGKLRPIKDWPDDLAAAVAGLETVHRNLTSGDGEVETILKVKRWDKPRVLELLSKHLGMLVEKHEVTLGGEIVARLQEARKRVAKRKGDA